MIVLISPAKSLNEAPVDYHDHSTPRMLEESQVLIDVLKKKSANSLKKLMGVSDKIAELNAERFRQFETPFTTDNAKPAIFTFSGDVYLGLQAGTFSEEELNFAQHHLRILSGLYGLLKPMDLMQPYRLEMGLKFANRGGRNLYEFWGDSITEELNRDLKKSGSKLLVNLASNEYFHAVKPRALDADIITPVFKDLKNGKYKIISFFAKKARGQMARYIIDSELNDPAGLKKFRTDGYRYNKAESTAREWVFTRDTPASAA